MKVMVTTLLCLTMMHCLAQETNRFSLGVKAGGGWSGWHKAGNQVINQNLPQNYIIENRFVPAYTFGLIGKYALTPRLSVNLGVQYLAGGSQFVNNYQGKNPQTSISFINRNEVTFRINSLHTPLYLSWDITQGNIRPFVKVGASSNWILGGYRKTYENNPNNSETREEKEDLSFELADNKGLQHDWSFYSGIGLNFHQRLLLEADLWLGPQRFYSFADRFAIPCFNCMTVSYFEETYHNRAILLTLSYLVN